MKYFKQIEFASPDKKGSGALMHKGMLLALDNARELADTPFNINSGYRTVKHNKAEGGKYDSSHLIGWAVDISCKTSVNREKIIRGLILAGFKRIGIAKTFIHADMDPDKPDCIWLY